MAGINDPTAVQFTAASAEPRSTLAADTTALIDGSAAPGAGTSRQAAIMVSRYAAGIVIGALVVLWLLGGIVFRDARIG